tara:strand:+ start:331 stop:600 length:270 start_codon:yes stop_codon:yes gene_type:complete
MIQPAEKNLSSASNTGTRKIIEFIPNDDSAARIPVPITTPKRCGNVALIPNFAPDKVRSIILGPGDDRPTNTKISKDKTSEILSPQNQN